MTNASERIYANVEKRCLTLDNSTLEFPFGEQTAVYKVGGKMFALLSQDREPPWLSIKLPPELGLELRSAYPDRVFPGYYLNKLHWNTFVLDGALAEDEVLQFVEQSYALVRATLPARLRQA
ncbi:MAG: MmcQ/YjbR family DNA-binding protein [Pseudonocardiaceae bacterium]